MLIGLTSILSIGAMAWIAANWLVPVPNPASRTIAARYARRDLLEQFQPFYAKAEFELRKTSGVAAWARQTAHQTGPHWIAGNWKHNRYGACGLSAATSKQDHCHERE